MIAIAALAAVLVGLLLLAEWRGWRPGIWLAKPLASAAIVGLAIDTGALASAYGHWVLVALVLSLAGDVLLIPKQARSFQFGLLAFLAAHLAYGYAFLVKGVDPTVLLAAALACAAAAAGVLRWLRPHLSGPLRVAVPVYVLAIAVMAALATGAGVRNGASLLIAGALLFCVSDLAVARQRFVRSGFANKVWGLPLYFLGQGLLAASVAGHG